ncbi:MAG: serine hydroxymethyltransferase [Gemmatimonadota bacterium]|nr:serine hydroxymethyltransferase [Gemmatimonadota bacterium]MDH5198614.1 serine hydroxymethyltransferase [Gemmatimonadota bacterium]
MRHLPIGDVDPQIAALIQLEARRQEEGLELIASENFTSRAVLDAMGSELTNKYAEGYPGRRYYGGCEVVDEVERLAIERAMQLFGAAHANVQPHSGAQANLAAYFAVLKPGDCILGMALSHGGHLTHGSPVNVSGQIFVAEQYGVDVQTGLLDMDQVREQARAVRPQLIIAGASAYPRVIDFAAFGAIAREVDAVLLVDMAHYAGLIAGGVYPSPVPHADIVTSTTHKTLRGPRGGFTLCTESWAKAVDKQVFPGMQGGPLEHIIAAKAVAFGEALRPEFRVYAAQVVRNAVALGERLAEHGFALVSGGTDSHMLLVDLRTKGLTGKAAQAVLDSVGIHINKNTIPGDPESPFVTSGIRVGTAALTTRGMMEAEMRRVADLINAAIAGREDDAQLAGVRKGVHELTAAFPLGSVTVSATE